MKHDPSFERSPTAGDSASVSQIIHEASRRARRNRDNGKFVVPAFVDGCLSVLRPDIKRAVPSAGAELVSFWKGAGWAGTQGAADPPWDLTGEQG